MTISYCWVDATDNISVVCDELRVLITRSLHGALRRFRPPRGTAARLLWADALCINQKDDEEKGKQVGSMDEIFANASSVLVWLGGNVDDRIATDTFTLISKINQHLDKAYLQFKVISMMPVLSE